MSVTILQMSSGTVLVEGELEDGRHMLVRKNRGADLFMSASLLPPDGDPAIAVEGFGKQGFLDPLVVAVDGDAVTQLA